MAEANNDVPTGTISKVVWLSQQSSASGNCRLDPSRNDVGYGYIDSDEEDQRIYFDYKAVADRRFEDVQVGQEVQYLRDAKFPVATSVECVGTLLDRSCGNRV